MAKYPLGIKTQKSLKNILVAWADIGILPTNTVFQAQVSRQVIW